MLQTFDIFIARFPYGRAEDPDVTDWLLQTGIQCRTDPRIRHLHSRYFDDTPITCTRNAAVQAAREVQADFLLMIDNDMSPDVDRDIDRTAKPFWQSSFDFAVQHYPQGPCVIAAPYCTAGETEKVVVFRWNRLRNTPDHTGKLDTIPREEAAQRMGIEKVDALATGLILYDLRAFERMTPPYFYYAYDKPLETRRVGTEDVTNTRDLSLLGVPMYVNWDAWAGHWKRYLIRKPQISCADDISENFIDAVNRGQRRDERVIVMGERP